MYVSRTIYSSVSASSSSRPDNAALLTSAVFCLKLSRVTLNLWMTPQRFVKVVVSDSQTKLSFGPPTFYGRVTCASSPSASHFPQAIILSLVVNNNLRARFFAVESPCNSPLRATIQTKRVLFTSGDLVPCPTR